MDIETLLIPLRQEYKDHPERRSTIELQVKCLKAAQQLQEDQELERAARQALLPKKIMNGYEIPAS